MSRLEEARRYLAKHGPVASRAVPDLLLEACLTLVDRGEATMYDQWDADNTNRNYFRLKEN